MYSSLSVIIGAATCICAQNPPKPNEEKYGDFDLSKEKLERALSEALNKIDYMMITFGPDEFPAHNSTNNVYPAVKNTSGWNQGFYTGILWHAYQLTGDEKYKERALAQIPGYYKRIDEKIVSTIATAVSMTSMKRFLQCSLI